MRRKTTLNQFLALFLAFVLCFSLLPVTPAAAEEAHNHNGVEYTAWTDSTKLPTAAGNYYLDTDVDLAAQYQPTKNITICLNGHTITSTSSSVTRLMMFNTNNITVTFEDCGFDGTYNHVGKITGGKGNLGWGGAICVYAASTTVNLNGIILEGNTESGTANTGGGALLLRSGTVNMTNTKVSGNSTTALNGGAVYVNAGQLTVSGCLFENNTCGGNGGAMFLNSGTTTTIEGSTFTGNQGTNGSAIRCSTGATLSVKDSIITGNKDLATGNYCGAVYALATDAALTVIEGATVIKGNENASGTAADLMLQNAGTVFTLKNPTAETELNIRSFGANKAAGSPVGILSGTLAGTCKWTSNSGLYVKADGTDLILAEKILVSGILLNQTTAELKEGFSLTLTATVAPEDALDKGLLWSSSDDTVATVDQSGNVTALQTGEAVITATAKDGSNVSASCTVTVIAAHTHGNGAEAVKYTVWRDPNSLPTAAGCYYLDTDVDLAAQYRPGKNITICLNGHTITSTSGAVTRLMLLDTKGITITFEDCGFAVNHDHVGRITGGKGNSGWGGAICLNADTSVLNLSGIILEGNTESGTANKGGGALLLRSGTVNMTNTKVSGNSTTALNGGAVYVNAGQLNVSGCLFENNTSGAKSGGAMYLDSGTTTIEGSTFIGNQGTNGSAIRCSTGAALSIKDSVITGNTDLTTGNYCGAVYVLATDAAQTVIEGATVIKNNKNASGTAADLMLQNAGTVFTLKDPTADTELNIRSFGTNKAAGSPVAVLSGALTGTCKWTSNDLLCIESDGSSLTLAEKTLVSEIQLDRTSAVMAKGDTIPLTATVIPDNAMDKRIEWRSSDDSVATVDQSGNITALQAGEAVITASALDGSNVTASCAVTVVDGHIHRNGDEIIVCTPWSDATALPKTAGHYYLETDVDLAAQYQLTTSVTITICLNGHTITSTSDSVTRLMFFNTVKSTITFEDCGFDGTYDHVGRITGGKGNLGWGGAICLNAATSVLNLSGIILEGNTESGTANLGGGALLLRSGTVNMTNTKVSGNSTTSLNGGAVYVNGGLLQVKDSVFEGNTSGEMSGGAIYLGSGGGTATFDGCTFTGNRGTNGSAIRAHSNATLILKDCVFTDNTDLTTGNYCGAVYVHATDAAKTVIEGATVIKNNKNDSGTAADLMLQDALTVFTLKNPTAETELNIRSFKTNKTANSDIAALEGAFAGTYRWTSQVNIFVMRDGTRLYLSEAIARYDGRQATVGQDINIDFVFTLSSDLIEKLNDAESGSGFTYKIGSTATKKAAFQIVGDTATISIPVPAKRMREEIVIRLMVDGTSVSFVSTDGLSLMDNITESVSDYLNAVAAAYPSVAELVEAMDSYGVAAAKYFAGETVDALDDYNPVLTDKKAVTGTIEGITYLGSTLSLENRIVIRHYFRIDDLTGLTVTGGTLRRTTTANQYCVELEGVKASAMDDVKTITVSDGGSTIEVQYSVFSYVKLALERSSDSNLKNLCKYLVKFYEAAPK